MDENKTFKNGLVAYEDRKRVVRPKTQIGSPVNAGDFQRVMLNAAGIDPTIAGEKLKRALDVLEAELEATKTSFFSKDGVVTDQRESEDNTSRIRAAESIKDTMIDLYASKRDDVKSGGVTVVISNWFGDEGETSINVTPS